MELTIFSDDHYMKEALREAEKAFSKDEVPIGAVIVCNNRIIARSHNLTEQLIDVTAHAEMQAITAAANYLGAKFLDECTIYVTVEPCAMCAGALFWSRIGKLVYGTSDEKKGFTTLASPILHPKTEIQQGVLKEACSQLMKVYFKNKR